MERALITLVDLARDDRENRVERRWHDHRYVAAGIPEGAVTALETRELVETDWSKWPRAALVRATDAGVALCDSMGD
jgi:hypothetical protein